MKEISKRNSIILWTIISIALSIIYTVVCKKLEVYENNLYIERIICVFGIIEFIGLNIIIGLKKLWDFIIDKRYIIALIFLVALTAFGISGTSVGALTSWILEPEKSNVIIGNFRYINSDEYAVEMPFAISQKNSVMSYFSNLNGLTQTDMNISVHSPTKNILILFRLYNIGYLFLNSSMAMSFAWNLKIIAMLIVTYEFMRIITKDKKYLSLIGTILIVCSSFINWWTDMASVILTFGELSLISIDKFMLCKNKKSKIIWLAVFAYSVISYVLSLYPAWIISFGYVFFALAIWIIIKNRKKYKFEFFDIVCFVGIITVTCAFGLYFYHTSYDAITSILNSSYPGARDENGGNGIKYLFSYLYSFLLPFGQEFDTKVFSSLLSFFPIPLIMAMIYIYKEEKHIDFILPILIVLCFESIWCMSGFPEVIAKITLFNKVPVERCAVSVGLGLIYLYIYMFANVDEKFIKQSNSVYIVLAILVMLFFVPVPAELDTKKNLYIFVMIEACGGFLLLNIGDKKYEKVFLSFALIITFVSGITINPIAKGVGPITETDFAKAVQKEVSNNPYGIWIAENTEMVIPNYLVSQGAYTLNVTQTYPSENFWKKILGEHIEDYKDIWNRYAHIKIQLTEDGESYIKLLTNDCIELYLSPNKLKDLNVQYIVSYNSDLEKKANLKKIYTKLAKENTVIEGEEVSGIYIYEFVN